MRLIERYIYAVTRHLPKDVREDVGEELEGNIMAMLPENEGKPKEKDVRAVLEQLGDPDRLANQYQPTNRYVIGPKYFDSYLSVLKLVTGITFILLTFLAVSQLFFNADWRFVAFYEQIATIISGVAWSAAWVTFVFVIIERKWGKDFEGKENWKIDDLPEIPYYFEHKLSRGKIIFSIIGTVACVSLLYFFPEIATIRINGLSGEEIFTIFNLDTLQSYMPFILALAALQIAIQIWQWITLEWSLKMAIFTGIYNVIACVVMLIILFDPALFSHQFIIFFDALEIDFVFAEGFRLILIMSGLMIVFACIADTFEGFRKYLAMKR